MHRHYRIRKTLLVGLTALGLSAAPAFSAESADATAQQHDAAASTHEKAARHHRAAAQHHRAGEHGVAKAYAKEADKVSAQASEKTKTATASSENVKYHAALSNDEL